MKQLLLTFVVLLSAVSTRAALAQTVADAPTVVIDERTVPFYAQLARHGQWVVTQRFGTVWQPREATNPHFRPYFTRGHWLATDKGWVFDCTYPWARIAYHYGRWAYADEASTWVWVPGTQWGAAWVRWQWNNDAIGWTPLAPEALPFAYDNDAYTVFVAAGQLRAPNFEAYLLPNERIAASSLASETNFAGWPRGPSTRLVSRRIAVLHVASHVQHPHVRRPPPAPRERRERPAARTRRIALAPPGASFAPPPEPTPSVARALPATERR